MSICIAALTLREIRLPLLEPFAAAHGTVAARRTLLLELEDGDGLRVWSECVALGEPSYSPETTDTAWLAIGEWLAPRVLGRAFAEPGEAHRVLGDGVRGHRMARAAVEMGVWALEAERRGTSLARLLGGERRKVAAGVVFGFQPSPEVLVEKARRAVAEGYRRLKVKIRPGADLEPLSELRAALGPDVPIAADANGAYTLDDADHLARLDPLRLQMIEQPLAPGDLVRHAELQRRIATPICLDESITSLERVEDMLALGSGRVVCLKPGPVGGLAEALAIHDLCVRRGVPLWCGGMLESGVGRAYLVALASLPGFSLPGDLSPPTRTFACDVVTPEWTLDPRGRVAVPLDAPGIGVTVDRDRVEDLTVRREVLRAA